jgi:hypothetical protein
MHGKTYLKNIPGRDMSQFSSNTKGALRGNSKHEIPACAKAAAGRRNPKQFSKYNNL